MKIISWNINGIRAIAKKGLADFLRQEKPDILCLQEIKAHREQVDEILENYENHFWNSAEKKGYSGTAVFSKINRCFQVIADSFRLGYGNCVFSN